MEVLQVVLVGAAAPSFQRLSSLAAARTLIVVDRATSGGASARYGDAAWWLPTNVNADAVPHRVACGRGVTFAPPERIPRAVRPIRAAQRAEPWPCGASRRGAPFHTAPSFDPTADGAIRHAFVLLSRRPDGVYAAAPLAATCNVLTDPRPARCDRSIRVRERRTAANGWSWTYALSTADGADRFSADALTDGLLGVPYAAPTVALGPRDRDRRSSARSAPPP